MAKLSPSNAQIGSVSCPSTGNCAAAGSYTDAAFHFHVFVVNEVNGVWGSAKEILATAPLKPDGNPEIYALSCASAGNCAAGGLWNSSAPQAFVVSAVKGKWGSAKEIPGSATLNAGGYAFVTALSCASAGNCAVGGFYTDAAHKLQAFVANQVKGIWGSAKEVPGTAALNPMGDARVESLSCPSAGNCVAAGRYRDSSGNYQGFVVSQVKGKWGTAKEIPGLGKLNAGGYAGVYSLSCVVGGNCAAGGTYTDASKNQQAFTVNEVKGRWGNAKQISGTAAPNTGGDAEARSVSCASAGNCSAGGFYTTSAYNGQAFVVNEVKGTWGSAQEVPGLAAFNANGGSRVASLSCSSAGNCAAGGYYTDASSHDQAFVANERNGKWGAAQEIPGTAALNAGGEARMNALSCAPSGGCAAGGYYVDGSGHQQPFLVDYTPAPVLTRLSPNHGPTGTLVTVTGKNLSVATAVRFGSAPAKIEKHISPTELQVMAPKDLGTVNVTITSAGGTSAQTPADRYTY